MKRVFSTPSRAFAAMLALSLSVAAPAQADLMGKMNPKNWFSGPSAEQSVELAQKQAQMAQQQADAALKAAQEAVAKAEQAKKQADELQAKAKPVVHDPSQDTSAEATQSASEAEQSAPETTADNQNASKGWGMPKIFKLSSKKQPEAAASTETTQTETAASSSDSEKQADTTEPAEQATSAASEATTSSQANDTASSEKTEEAQTSEHASGGEQEAAAAKQPSASTPWNPLTWFSKPHEQTDTASASTDTNSVDTSKIAAPTANEAETPSDANAAAEVNLKTRAAVLETEKGNISFELYPDQAPQTVANFAKLVNQGFYNKFNMKFHRVVPGFVIQTGDPTGTGAGGSKDRVPLEAKNKLSHNAKGVVAMARGADPNSATSQFYITLSPQTNLDGKYAVFGKVIAGLDVLDKIEVNDMLYGIRLVDINSVTRDAQPDKKKFFSSLF